MYKKLRLQFLAIINGMEEEEVEILLVDRTIILGITTNGRMKITTAIQIKT